MPSAARDGCHPKLEGQEAFRQGAPISKNPYRPNTYNGSRWRDAWIFAQVKFIGESAGRAAFWAGLPTHANPHKMGTHSRAQWIDGWFDAQAEK